MADTLKQLGKGTLTDSSVTLYTVPSTAKCIVKSVILANKTANEVDATILFDGVNIVPAHVVPPNDTLVIQMTAILEDGNLITGLSETAGAIDYYLSGIEVI